jgi:glycosyltransferase involved in cell wall biosynthesis
VLRRTADIVFVDNEETGRALVAAGFAAAKLKLTANAYDPPHALPPRTRPVRPRVVFVGRLVEVKGLEVVLDLAAELARRGIDADIDLIGDGPGRARVEERIRVQELHSVRLAGFVGEDEKWEALRGATLFVAPSREEGWGIAVGEAVFAGTPTLVYDLPAYCHLGDALERVPDGDAAAFVARAVELLTDPARQAQAQAQVDAARTTLPRWDAVLDAEIEVLQAAA